MDANHNTPENPLAASISHFITQLPPRDQVDAGGEILKLIARYMPVQAQEPPQTPLAAPPPDDPPTPEAPRHEPLTDAEQEILDLLRRAPIGEDGEPMSYKGPEIAQGIDRSYNYIKDLLGPGGELRARGLIKHRQNVGYRIGRKTG